MRGGLVSVEDIYISTRMYFLRQLHQNNGRHYRRISHFIGMSRIEMIYITNKAEDIWKKIDRIMKHVNLTFWEDLFKTIRKTFNPKGEKNP